MVSGSWAAAALARSTAPAASRGAATLTCYKKLRKAAM
jgi:hypothetical protein